MSYGHRVVGITNGHFIHAGPLKGPKFLSIYDYDQGCIVQHLRTLGPWFFENVLEL